MKVETRSTAGMRHRLPTASGAGQWRRMARPNVPSGGASQLTGESPAGGSCWMSTLSEPSASITGLRSLAVASPWEPVAGGACGAEQVSSQKAFTGGRRPGGNRIS